MSIFNELLFRVQKKKNCHCVTAEITHYREVRPQHYILANCSDNGDGKIKRADELPLRPSAMRLCLMDHSLDLVEIVLNEAVLFLIIERVRERVLMFCVLILKSRVPGGGGEGAAAPAAAAQRHRCTGSEPSCTWVALVFTVYRGHGPVRSTA